MYMYTEAQNHCLFLFNNISKAYIIIGSSLELKIHFAWILAPTITKILLNNSSIRIKIIVNRTAGLCHVVDFVFTPTIYNMTFGWLYEIIWNCHFFFYRYHLYSNNYNILIVKVFRSMSVQSYKWNWKSVNWRLLTMIFSRSPVTGEDIDWIFNKLFDVFVIWLKSPFRSTFLWIGLSYRFSQSSI